MFFFFSFSEGKYIVVVDRFKITGGKNIKKQPENDKQ